MATNNKASSANAHLIPIFKWFTPISTFHPVEKKLIAFGKIGAQVYFIESQLTAGGETLYRAFIQKKHDEPVELVDEVSVEKRYGNVIVSLRHYNDYGPVIPTQIFTHIFQTAIPAEVVSILGQLPGHLIGDLRLNRVLERMGFLIKPNPDHYYVIVLPWVALKHNHHKTPTKDEGQLSVAEYMTYVFFDHKLRKNNRNIFFQKNLFLFCNKEHQSRYHLYRQAEGDDKYIYYLAVLHTIHFAISVEIILSAFHLVQLSTNEMSNFHLLRPLVDEIIKDSINSQQPVCTGEIAIPARDQELIKHAFRTAGFTLRTVDKRISLYLDMRPGRSST